MNPSFNKRIPLFHFTLAALWFITSTQAQAPKPDATTGIDAPKLVVQLGNSGLCDVVAYSPDGRFVVTSAVIPVLWDAMTGIEIRRFAGHTDGVRSVAFSPDGKFILTGSQDKTAQLWDIETGEMVRRFEGHTGELTAVKFSPNGKYVLSAGKDKTARLWDSTTGKEVVQFLGHSFEINCVAFSTDGQLVLTGSGDNTARLWNASTGKELKKFQHPGDYRSVRSAALSPDGRLILTASTDTLVRLWDVATGAEIRQFAGPRFGPPFATFSPDGRFALISGEPSKLIEVTTGAEIRRFETDLFEAAFSPDGQLLLTTGEPAKLWDVKTGTEVRRFEGYVDNIRAAAISFDRRYVVTGGYGTIIDGKYSPVANLWDLTGNEVRGLRGHTHIIKAVAFSPDSRFVLTGSGDGTAKLWDVATGIELRNFQDGIADVWSVAFSPDGRFVVVGYQGKPTKLWDAPTGKLIRQFRVTNDIAGQNFITRHVAFTPDGLNILTGEDNHARLFDIETGKQIRSFYSQATLWQSQLSPDGTLLLTSSEDNIVRIWNVATGKEVRQFQGSALNRSYTPASFSSDGKAIWLSSIDTVRLFNIQTGEELKHLKGKTHELISQAQSADGRLLITTNRDSVSLWNADSGTEFCRLVSFRDGTWVVVNSEGRFDTNNLEAIRGLNWIVPDDPMRTLPLEIFMRDYYEPRLLERLIRSEPLKPARSLSQLNRIQPGVKIIDIHSQTGAPDLVTVTVEVAKGRGEIRKENRRLARETGVYDLRLFRNGQIVGQSPLSSPTNLNGHNDDINVWRQSVMVKLDPQGKQRIKFENIRIPRRQDLREIQFSAYAFNEDRVKSETAVKSFTLPANLVPVKGRAYVLTMGVNVYQNSSWNLKFAVNDARLAQKIFSENLRKAGDFEEVIELPLLSDSPQGIAKPATKANFRAVLAQLAPIVRPEDLLIIYFSGHGYADAKGNFYLFPTDLGAGSGKQINEAMLARCISSEELSEWLKMVDAGDLVMVIDACQSSAAWEREGFKPGPMGSRGLGQLAYDKGMQILAASQADDVALEINQLRHGLLTYALIRDGIEARKGDILPRDGKLTLSESFTYSLQRVPILYQSIIKKDIQRLFQQEGGRGPIVAGEQQSLKSKTAFQKPSLFDFMKKKREIRLAR
jgi:WD40 repeat protein